MMVCIGNGCNNEVAVVKRMMCLSHASMFYRDKDKGECTHEGCDRNQYAKGYCNVHYRRLNQGLPMDRVVASHQKCAYKTCDRFATSLKTGLCATHFQQHQAGVELHDIQKRFGIKDGQRQCTKCEQVKSLSEYYLRFDNNKGTKVYTGRCKPCYLEDKKKRERAK